MISDKQIQVFQFVNSNKKALICDGAVRSGKTSFITITFVLWAMKNFNNQNFAICGKTLESAKRNIVEPFLNLDYTKLNYKIDIKNIGKEYIISNNVNTNKFYIFGGDTERSYTKIQGLTLAGVFLDEVVLMPRSFVEQALIRCSVDGSKYFFSCNPADSNHWFYLDFIQKSKERNFKYLKFELEDNPSLTTEILDNYKKQFVGVYYQRYILGNWVNAEGLIYRIFVENQEKFYIDKNLELYYCDLSIGVDFGGTKSKHAFVCCAINKKTSKIYVLESVKYEPSTTDNLIKDFKDFLNLVENKYKRKINYIYVDSAEQVLKASLQEHINIPIRNSIKNPIKYRLQMVNIIFGKNLILINKEGCQTLINALNTCIYDSETQEDTRLDNGVYDVDTLDAFEYSIEYIFKKII